ncbi:hypothetical protein AMJ80_08875 [bacterium SM23_31]|nr:MAG: hypothetical protein AMJ80_08875 [bacterium SM23_31]
MEDCKFNPNYFTETIRILKAEIIVAVREDSDEVIKSMTEMNNRLEKIESKIGELSSISDEIIKKL